MARSKNIRKIYQKFAFHQPISGWWWVVKMEVWLYLLYVTFLRTTWPRQESFWKLFPQDTLVGQVKEAKLLIQACKKRDSLEHWSCRKRQDQEQSSDSGKIMNDCKPLLSFIYIKIFFLLSRAIARVALYMDKLVKRYKQQSSVGRVYKKTQTKQNCIVS